MQSTYSIRGHYSVIGSREILSSNDDLSHRSVYSSSMLSMDVSGPGRPGDVCVALYLLYTYAVYSIRAIIR
jgi:hypothetical protein